MGTSKLTKTLFEKQIQRRVGLFGFLQRPVLLGSKTCLDLWQFFAMELLRFTLLLSQMQAALTQASWSGTWSGSEYDENLEQTHSNVFLDIHADGSRARPRRQLIGNQTAKTSIALLQMIRSFAPSTTLTVGIVVRIVAFKVQLDARFRTWSCPCSWWFGFFILGLEVGRRKPFHFNGWTWWPCCWCTATLWAFWIGSSWCCLSPAAVTKLAEVMPDVHACKKKSAGFSKKSKSREGFFRKVLGTAELAEKKVFFDVAHAERLNKPSSFMLVGCVSATRATSEMCLSCREINGQIKFSSATCACVKQKGCPFLLQVVTKPRAKIAKGWREREKGKKGKRCCRSCSCFVLESTLCRDMPPGKPWLITYSSRHGSRVEKPRLCEHQWHWL